MELGIFRVYERCQQEEKVMNSPTKVTWVSSARKGRSPRVMKKSYVKVGNKGFLQLPNK
jgi:hypothetical protein